MSRRLACSFWSGAAHRGARSIPRVLVVAALSSASLASCGGSPNEPKSAVAASQADARDAARADEDEPAARQAPSAALCDDGTCSACGSGICPTGWYCDESAQGGPACGWLPQCAQKASCGCVNHTLGADCACAERAGGLHVSCK